MKDFAHAVNAYDDGRNGLHLQSIFESLNGRSS